MVQVELKDREPKTQGEIYIFTNREYQVLNLTAQGFSYQEIGKQLHGTEGIIKGVATRVFDKLGLGSGLKAIQMGLDLRLVDKLKVLERTDITKVNFLTPQQRRILSILIEDQTEDDSNSYLADRVNISVSTVKEHLKINQDRLNTRNRKHSVAVYKSLQPNVVQQNIDTMVFVDHYAVYDADTFSVDQIAQLHRLYQGVPMQLTQEQIVEIKSKIKTPARLAALIKGFETKLGFLPLPTQEPNPDDILTIMQARAFAGIFLY